MNSMEKDLKEIKKGQNKIIRKLEFIINSVVFTIGLVNVRTGDSKIEVIKGIIVAVLAAASQGLLVFEDIKEIIEEPDEEDIEEETEAED